jgi:hypothetical protein
VGPTVVLEVVVVVVVLVMPVQFKTEVRVVSLVIEKTLCLLVLPVSNQWSNTHEPYPCDSTT